MAVWHASNFQKSPSNCHYYLQWAVTPNHITQQNSLQRAGGQESPLMNKKGLMNNLRHYQNYLIMNAIKATPPLDVVLILCLAAFMRINFS